jgi:hypothetical protein
MFVPFAALSSLTASFANASCSPPIGAAGPVIGSDVPTDALHDFVPPPVEADVLPELLELLELFELLLLLLPQATTNRAVSVIRAAVKRLLTSMSSSSGIHSSGAPG